MLRRESTHSVSTEWYTTIGQLLPREGHPSPFSQIYIHDGTPEAELEYRSIWERGPSLSSEVFRI